MQAALIGLLAFGRLLKAAISGVNRLADNKWPIHDDAQVAVPPHHDCVGKAVLGWDERMFGEKVGQLRQPVSNICIVHDYKLFCSRKRLRYNTAIDAIRRHVETGLSANSSVWCDICNFFRIRLRACRQFLPISEKYSFNRGICYVLDH